MATAAAVVGIGTSIYGAVSSRNASKSAKRAEEERYRKNVELTREALDTLQDRTDRALEVFYERRDESLGTYQDRALEDLKFITDRSGQIIDQVFDRTTEDIGIVDTRTQEGYDKITGRTADDLSFLDDNTRRGLEKIGVRTREDLNKLDIRTQEQFGLVNMYSQARRESIITKKVQRNLAIKQASMKAKGEALVSAAASGAAGRRVELNLERETGQLEADAISQSREQQVNELTDLFMKHEDAVRNLEQAREDTEEDLIRRHGDITEQLLVQRDERAIALGRRHEDVVDSFKEQRKDALLQLERRYMDIVQKVGKAEADAIIQASRDEADLITQDRINSEDTLYNITNYHNDTAQRMLDNLNNSAPVYTNVPGTAQTLLAAGANALNAYTRLPDGIRQGFNDTISNLWDGVTGYTGSNIGSFQNVTPDWNFMNTVTNSDALVGSTGGLSIGATTPEWSFM